MAGIPAAGEQNAVGWQAIRDELMRRIAEGAWKPGETVPHEVALAGEFGCSRATINRAMQEIADAGFLERRRKSGTRVAANPVRRARLEIPITRLDIEGRGMAYRYELVERAKARPPAAIRNRLGVPAGVSALHVRARHFADSRPYLLEDRWINTQLLPLILDVDLALTSANEWLVRNAPFSHGEMAVSAASATEAEADMLEVTAGTPVFAAERITWRGAAGLTLVRLLYAPGFRLVLTL